MHKIPRIDDSRLAEIFALELLTFLEPEGKVGYRHGEKGAERETMDYLEFIARVTSHIPDKGHVMVRYHVRQRPPGKGQESELESFDAPDGRGGAPVSKKTLDK